MIKLINDDGKFQKSRGLGEGGPKSCCTVPTSAKLTPRILEIPTFVVHYNESIIMKYFISKTLENYALNDALAMFK